MTVEHQIIVIFTQQVSDKLSCVMCGCGCLQALQPIEFKELCAKAKAMLNNIKPDFLTSNDSDQQVGG